MPTAKLRKSILASCSVVVALLLPIASGQAVSIIGFPGTNTSVTSSVVPLGPSQWQYQYTLTNNSICNGLSSGTACGIADGDLLIASFDIPFFGDAGILNILDPSGWQHSTETIGTNNTAHAWDGVAAWQISSDPNYQGPASPFTSVTQVLHWWDTTSTMLPSGAPIPPGILPGGGSAGGFGYIAGFPGTKSPHQLGINGISTASFLLSGDPQIPNSPSISAPAAVPSPGTLSLLGIGILGLTVTPLARRRKRQT